MYLENGTVLGPEGIILDPGTIYENGTIIFNTTMGNTTGNITSNTTGNPSS